MLSQSSFGQRKEGRGGSMFSPRVEGKIRENNSMDSGAPYMEIARHAVVFDPGSRV